MMKLKFDIPKTKDKIYIIGSGASGNKFDFNNIDYETSIIITMNAALELVNRADFLMMGDWLALRKCLNNDYKGAQIVCRHELGKCNLEYAKDSEKELDSHTVSNHIELLHKINTNLLMHHPIFMEHNIPLELFDQDNKADYCLRNWIIPTYSLSGAAAMALAFLISETNKHIKDINYVGLDGIYIPKYGVQNFPYTEKLRHVTLDFRKQWAFSQQDVLNNLDEMNIYSMQHFCLIMLISLSERFYNKLNSFSYVDYKRIPFSKVLFMRKDVVKHIVAGNKQTIKKYPFVENAIGIYQKMFKFCTLGGDKKWN